MHITSYNKRPSISPMDYSKAVEVQRGPERRFGRAPPRPKERARPVRVRIPREPPQKKSKCGMPILGGEPANP